MKLKMFLLGLLLVMSSSYCAIAEITDISFDNPVFNGDSTELDINTEISFYSTRDVYLCISVEEDVEIVSDLISGVLGDKHSEATSFTLESENYDSKGNYDINFLLATDIDCTSLLDKEIRKFSVMKKRDSYYIPENHIYLVGLIGLICAFVLSRDNTD